MLPTIPVRGDHHVFYTIRPAEPADRQALFDVCLRTAHSGEDATAFYSDPLYPGVVWSVPYLELEPRHAFVLAGPEGVVGYIVGTPDTAGFAERLETEWWPHWREHFAGRTSQAPHDVRVLDYVRNPPTPDAWLEREYPGHLHINILPHVQSGGWGRKLIETELDSQRAAGVPGVHLGVSPTNYRAIGFYQHVGFSRLETLPGVVFGRKLA